MIGTDAAGTTAVTNGSTGLSISDAPDNVITGGFRRGEFDCYEDLQHLQNDTPYP